MDIIYSTFTSSAYIDLPNHIAGWAGVFLFTILLIFTIWQWFEGKLLETKKQLFGFILLFIVVPVSSLAIGIRIVPDTGYFQWQAIPGVPAVIPPLAVMVFSALPWVLAAIFLTPLSSVLLALESSVLLAVYGSHSLFTIFTITITSIAFLTLYRQDIRTRFFRWINHPISAALLCGFVVIPLSVIGSIFELNTSFSVKMDYAFNHAWLYGVAHWFEIMIAGIIAEIIFLIRGKSRQTNKKEKISLIDSGLESRVMFGYLLALAVLMILGVYINWIVAGRIVRENTKEKISNASRVTAYSLPYLFEYGQNLIQQMAENDVVITDVTDMKIDLPGMYQRAPFFTDISVYNEIGEIIDRYPGDADAFQYLSDEEQNGISYALHGVRGQNFIIQSQPGKDGTRISFMSGLYTEDGQMAGVLVGRADLENSPIFQPEKKLLDEILDDGGYWAVVDENKQIIFHSNYELLGTDFNGVLPDAEAFFEDVTPTGIREFVYATPVTGRLWYVIVSIPLDSLQQDILWIVISNMLFFLLAAVICYWIIHLNLHRISQSVKKMTQEVRKITQDQIDQPVSIRGYDEVGKLGLALEKMRVSFKDRHEEMDRIMKVRKSVPSSLDVNNSMQQVLDVCLLEDASVARVVLDSSVLLERIAEPIVAYGTGEKAEYYYDLDEQIYHLMKKQGLLVIPNTRQEAVLQTQSENELPGAMIIASLYHENRYLGALWIGFEKARTFPDEWLQLIDLIVTETSLAIANIRLYANAEVDRHRFEAALASIPDPVLVFDETNALIMANPAALQLKELFLSTNVGSRVEDVVSHRELVESIKTQTNGQKRDIEIELSGGRSFHASVSRVVNDNQSNAGTICVFKEVSEYKALDAIKSDFVSTVSHDLRSPLTQVSGYVTMLQMVGDLNEQQNGYIEKINNGLLEMTHLITNLLDLGRIEAGVGLQIEKTDVNKVVDQVVNVLQPRITQKKLNLEKSASHEEIIIDVDQALLNQALMNLIDNAINYTPVEGNIQVKMIKKINTIQFEIKDTGIGVAPIDLPHIFDKFYLAGRRDGKNKRGVGLGLSIVKSIADRHRGKVWAESQLGKGSIFYLEIPIRSKS